MARCKGVGGEKEEDAITPQGQSYYTKTKTILYLFVFACYIHFINFSCIDHLFYAWKIRPKQSTFSQFM